ncbi:sialidase family protein [Arthrobacter sp. fls2-241-R2A-172]|uniref:sialidase family protein n=1 Tax=Arthrobacter sp. fls2-241-R2A-172 TaxID=3040325 RepID=UPI00254B1067|nr:sialidase family protein [Arthrobacter sp. fls2-241-R2A-172]
MTSYLQPSQGHPPLAEPSVEHVLAVRGVGGYRQYRIPALAVSTRGTVLAAYDGRPNLDDLPNPIDLLLRRSEDNGNTWGPQQVVRTGSGLQGFGDPSLLVDAATGRIFMFHAAGTHAGFFEAVAGMEPDDDVQHADLSYSDDDGDTWQHRRLTAQLKTGRITGLFAAAGQGIQIHTGPYKGRLVQQFVVLVDGAIMAASAFSDDHGENWALGELIGPGVSGIGPNENKVVCLDDGRLLLHSRATPHRLSAFSKDGGVSWSPLQPIPDMPDPSDNGSVARFDGLPSAVSVAEPSASHPEHSRWLIASNNQDPHLRRNTVLSLSPDNGATWPAKLVVCPGSSAYSTVTRLPDGNVGVLYERQGYRDIVFASIPAGQLTQQLAGWPGPAPALVAAGAYAAEVSTAGESAVESGGLVFHMELRSITPGRPTVWQNAGDFHVVPSNSDGQWDVQTWKEIGQGYADHDQVLGTREAQDLNYGAIIPGYKAGDILAFTGRARNVGSQAATGVELLGPHGNTEDFPPTNLPPGGHILYFTPTYTITDSDLLRETLDLVFTVEADAGSGPTAGPVRLDRTFSFDLRTGAVEVS